MAEGVGAHVKANKFEQRPRSGVVGRGLGEATKSKTVGISGRVAERDFAAEVEEIGIGERFFEEFFDDGQKVVEGANRAERGCGW